VSTVGLVGQPSDGQPWCEDPPVLGKPRLHIGQSYSIGGVRRAHHTARGSEPS
jgi:hypothetical protein